jgi:hypothetical protein
MKSRCGTSDKHGNNAIFRRCNDDADAHFFPKLDGKFLLSDFGASFACSSNVIFLLTSLFIDSRFQTVATDDRCVIHEKWKGE